MSSMLTSISSDLAPKLESFSDSFKRIAESGYKAISNFNNVTTEAGSTLFDLIHQQKTGEKIMAGGYLSELKNIWSPIDIMNRRGVNAPVPTMQKQWNDTQDLVGSIYNQVAQRGLKVLDPTGTNIVDAYKPDDFFPKILTPEVFKPGSLKNELIDHLVNTNQLPDTQTGLTYKDDAEKFVDKMHGMLYGKKGVAIMHDMLGLKIPDKFMVNEPLAAYSMWADAAARFITKVDTFGPKNEDVKGLIKGIGHEYGWTAEKLASDAFDTAEYGYSNIGKKYYSGKNYTEEALKGWEGLTKLGLMSIQEPTQALNALYVTSGKSMIKSLSDLIHDPEAAVEYGLKSGAMISDSLKDFKDDALGKTTWLSSMLKYTGFDLAHKFVLVLSANAGKHYAQELSERFLANPTDSVAISELKSIGLEPTRIMQQGGLSQNDILKAGVRTTEMTQFLEDPLDLPLVWNKNPFMRTLMMYKTFAYKQGILTYDHVFKKAFTKPENLIYLSILAPIFGELAGDLQSVLRGQNPGDERMQYSPATKLTDNKFAARYLDNIAQVGNIGFFMSAMNSVNRDNVSRFIGGPVIGDIEDLGRTMVAMRRGRMKYAAAQVARRVPVVGSATANIINK